MRIVKGQILASQTGITLGDGRFYHSYHLKSLLKGDKERFLLAIEKKLC